MLIFVEFGVHFFQPLEDISCTETLLYAHGFYDIYFFTFCTFLRADVTSEFPHCEIETVLFMYMSLKPVVVRVFDVIT